MQGQQFRSWLETAAQTLAALPAMVLAGLEQATVETIPALIAHHIAQIRRTPGRT